MLGCLVEKQCTTPQQYPLTENALIAACNQTTSRDPIVAYDVADVRIAVRSLREKGLLRMVHRSGERSDKHQHLLDTSLALSAGPLTLLAILLLRGPQTWLSCVPDPIGCTRSAHSRRRRRPLRH